MSNNIHVSSPIGSTSAYRLRSLGTQFLAALLFGGLALLFLPPRVLFAQESITIDAAALSRSGLLIVGYDPALAGGESLDDLARHGYVIEQHWPRLRLAALRVAEAGDANQLARMEEAITHLRDEPAITHVSGDLLVSAAGAATRPVQQEIASAFPHDELIPGDPMIDQQWAITRTSVISGWQISRGAPSVTIALVDSGYDVTHEDLAPESLWQNPVEAAGELGVDDDGNGFIDDLSGWDWIEQDGITNDPFGHGNHTGGIIAATADNGIGVAGVGGAVRILPLRILDAYGGGQMSDLIAALDYALEQDVQIVNMSLTLHSDQPALEQAISVLAEEGILLVAAAGNQDGPVLWPAAYPGALAVAATDREDLRAEYSNVGPEVAVAAPGHAILSTYREGSYEWLDGTSMAAPHVAALAGLLAGLRPDLSGADLAQIIQLTASDVNANALPASDEELGAGRIDFHAALYAASTALQLSLAEREAMLPALFPGAPVSKQLVVMVAGKSSDMLPIAGAGATYRIYDPAAMNQTLSSGRAVSDGEGLLTLELVAPPSAGDYLLEVRVGAVETRLPFIVSASVAALQLTPAHLTVEAASGPQLIALDLLDDEGQPIDLPASVRLATNLGSLGEERLQVVDLLVEKGSGEVIFRPGGVAGSAQITATIGSLTTTVDIEVLPGAPSSVQLPSLPKQVAVIDQPVTVALEIRVADRFGNPVADGTEVELAASDGDLTILDTMTENGMILANLKLTAGDVSPVSLRAAVPHSTAQVEADLTLQSHHLWLPLVTR